MEEKKPSGFYTSNKISVPFKAFLSIFLIIGLSYIGYLLYIYDAGLQSIIGTIFVAILGIVLILRLFSKAIRIRDLTNLSELEESHINDLASMKITTVLKKVIFPDVDIRPILAFVVIVGGILGEMFFYIFIMCLILTFFTKNNTIFDKIMMLSLAIIWCPWIGNMLVKRISYKSSLLFKWVLTIAVFFIGIKVSP